MNSYHKEATVGLFVLVGVALFLFGTMWLSGRAFGNPPTITVAFPDIQTLKEGSPVRVSGAVIGSVETITLERPGRVLVTMNYDRALVTPAADARAALVAVGMLGDMVIDLDPGTGAPLGDGAVIEGTVTPGLFDLGGSLATQAETTLAALNAMLDPALVADLRRTLASSERLMAYLADGRNGPTAEVNATMRALQGVSARLDSTLGAVDARALGARLDTTLASTATLTDQLARTTRQVDSLLAGMRRGEGTLGKLAADSSLYVELRGTLEATRALVDELTRNPGKVGVTVKLF